MSKGWNELTDVERLAVKQALYKVLASDVGTRDPDNLRGRVNAAYLGMYESVGAKSYDVNLNGMKVGTMSVTVAKAKTEVAYDLIDADAFAAWLSTMDGHECARQYAMEQGEKFVRWVIDAFGEVPEGVDVRTVEVPEHAKGTTLRVDEHKVARAMGNQLAPAVMGLLEG